MSLSRRSTVFVRSHGAYLIAAGEEQRREIDRQSINELAVSIKQIDILMTTPTRGTLFSVNGTLT